MASLSANEKSFVKLMRKSDEHARRGFDLLVKRQDPEKFFDELAAKSLFSPSEAPAPVRVDENSIRFPQWSALTYLLQCARISDERNDIALAQSVMGVVRAVTAFREEDGHVRDNYVTFWRFAEIVGAVPNAVVTIEDIDLARIWLNNRFDRMMVASALSEGVLRRCLASNDPADWDKAIQLLPHCLAIVWQPERARGMDEEEPVTIVDPYWLKKLIGQYAEEFGKKAGAAAATIFRERVQELYSKGSRASLSYVFRPAVEDHAQNRSWHDADNCLVEGLRDVLLVWSGVDLAGTRLFINDLLRSNVEMLRRVGIYVLDERWNELGGLFDGIVGTDLFTSGHIHELFHLLRNHFDQFDAEQKMATVAAIRDIGAPAVDDAELLLKWIQRRWLEAIAGTTYGPVATWIAELARDPRVSVQLHPDFNTYIEGAWGPGPSPYQVEELVAFVRQGTLVEKLNAFIPQPEWRGVSREALGETLRQAVLAAPAAFARALPSFLAAKPTYQQGVVGGFKRLWDAPKEQQAGADWDEIWSNLFGFLEKLFENPQAGRKSEVDDDFAQSWLVSETADLLEAGTRDDNHAYPTALLPRGWALLSVLAARAEAAQQPDDRDPMTQALNTPKGRTIEAIVGHALRESRLADKNGGSHAGVWDGLRPLFERELEKCETGNYEFVTLAAASIANLEYLDADWLQAHVTHLFPAERPAHFGCALGGFAYSSATRGTYGMLRDAGVIDAALEQQLTTERTRKTLIQRVMLAYLWDEEALDSPRIAHLFDRGLVDDLEAAGWFLSSVRGEELTQSQIAKIIAFWDKCVSWAEAQAGAPEKLLSTLASLAWSLSGAEGRQGELLLAVAPFADIAGHATHEFLKELLRLAEVSPVQIAAVLGTMVETYSRTYDYEGAMKALITRLAELGQRPVALDYCERLRHVDGLPELFRKLHDAGP